MRMPQIEVSQYIKSKLDVIYEAEEHKSYDSVIRSMLAKLEIIEEEMPRT